MRFYLAYFLLILPIDELVFDNTYSWMTSKELIVKVSLEAPGKDTDEDV